MLKVKILFKFANITIIGDVMKKVFLTLSVFFFLAITRLTYSQYTYTQIGRITGDTTDVNCGAITPLGDINGDGFDDFAVYYYGNNHYYIKVFGGSSAYNFNSDSFIKFTGSTYEIPAGIFSIGDINKDGYDDFAISYTQPYSFHELKIYYGKAQIDTCASYTLSDDLQSASFLGDVNGDGYDDFMVWSNYLPITAAKSKNIRMMGIAKLYLGGKTFDESNYISFGNYSSHFEGSNICRIGDINNDGYNDFAIGYPSPGFFVPDSNSLNKIKIFMGEQNINANTGAILDSSYESNYGKDMQYAGALSALDKNCFFTSSDNNVYVYSGKNLKTVFANEYKNYRISFACERHNTEKSYNNFAILSGGYKIDSTTIAGKADFYISSGSFPAYPTLTIYGNRNKQMNNTCAFIGKTTISPENVAIGYTDGDVLLYSISFFDNIKETSKVLPYIFNLSQNYPNPFNPSTEIEYSVQTASRVEITVYNALGQKVKTLVSETKTPGNYKALFNAGQLCSGIYFYRFSAQSLESEKECFSACRKMLLLK